MFGPGLSIYTNTPSLQNISSSPNTSSTCNLRFCYHPMMFIQDPCIHTILMLTSHLQSVQHKSLQIVYIPKTNPLHCQLTTNPYHSTTVPVTSILVHLNHHNPQQPTTTILLIIAFNYIGQNQQKYCFYCISTQLGQPHLNIYWCWTTPNHSDVVESLE